MFGRDETWRIQQREAKARFETLVKMRRPKRGSVLSAEKRLSSSVCLVLVCATFRATVGVKEKGKMVKEERSRGKKEA